MNANEGWQPEALNSVSERARRFVAPALRGRHVHLRAVTPDDYAYLRLVETSSELAPRWRLRGSTPGANEWAQGISAGVLAQFMIIANKDQAPVGQVTAHEANFQDGHARLAATRFNPSSRSPLMILGFALFVEYVLSCWNFHKLYLEVAEYNYAQLVDQLENVVTPEGRLRQHYHLNGELWDHLVFAIYRDVWYERGDALLQFEHLA